MAYPYSPQVRAVMDAVRRTAQMNEIVVCWWCGGRPWDGLWHSDHIFALLGEKGPVLAACALCNNSRRRRLPTRDKCMRAFHSDKVVRSCSQESLQHIAREAAEDIFGGVEWIRLLIAAVDSKSPRQQILNGRYGGGVAHRETVKLRETLARKHDAAIQTK